MCKRCAIVCPVRKCKYWLLGQSTLSLSLPFSLSLSLCVSLCIVLWALFTSHFPSLASMSFCRNVIQICVNRLSSGFTCLMPHASCLMTQAACPVRGRGCLFSSCCPPRLLCAIVKLLWLVGNLGRTQDTGTKQTRHWAGHRCLSHICLTICFAEIW